MANVNIKFNGKEYLLSCEDGQEEHLEELSVNLNKKFSNLKDTLGNIGENKLDKMNQDREKESKKELEFSEKIDELNQETDTLLEEIDKWQM